MRSSIKSHGPVPLITIITFAFIVIGGALYTELFQKPEFEVANNQIFRNPIDINFLSNARSMKIKNTLGSYRVIKKSDVTTSTWNVSTPRSVPAKNELINEMIQSLSQIKVRRTYPNDDINKDHFFLRNPNVTITLGTSTDPTDQDMSINVGLINPIDNSTYISISNSKLIYQINTIKFPFESIEFTDLIDSRVVPVSKDEIAEVAYFKGNSSSSFFKIKRHQKQWIDSRKFVLRDDRVDDFLQNILSYNAQVILDQDSESRQEVSTRFLKAPIYRLKVTTMNGNSHLYEISKIVHKSYPELKIEKRQNILVKANYADHPFVLSKQFLQLFYRTEKFMRDRKKPKKLF